jgi:predicted nucleic acid-binding protein
MLRPAGPPGTILRLILAGVVPLVMDERILQEYEEVAKRPRFKMDEVKIAVVLDHIRALGEMVVPRPLSLRLPDPDDIIFREAAVDGKADAIVTGNKKHFPASSTKNVVVLNAREALEMMAEED